MQQCTDLTRTNSRPLDRVDLSPFGTAKRWECPHLKATAPGDWFDDETQLLPLPVDIQDLPGDHTRVVTPVPIPNTAVKHTGPMIVRTARK